MRRAGAERKVELVVSSVEADPEVDSALELPPEGRVDPPEEGDRVVGDRGARLADRHLHLRGSFSRLDRSEVAATVIELDLERLVGVDGGDTIPLDVDGSHRVGLAAQPAALELLDLAGDPVAIVERDDVGLLRESNRAPQQEPTTTDENANEPGCTARRPNHRLPPSR